LNLPLFSGIILCRRNYDNTALSFAILLYSSAAV
jgi:hypothetical protein